MRCGCCGFLLGDGPLAAAAVIMPFVPGKVGSCDAVPWAPVTPHTIDKT
jgi:hypothetical protein